MTSSQAQCRSADDFGCQATALAEQWLSRRSEHVGNWHNWVATQLYRTRPLALAKQARRELQRLAEDQRA